MCSFRRRLAVNICVKRAGPEHCPPWDARPRLLCLTSNAGTQTTSEPVQFSKFSSQHSEERNRITALNSSKFWIRLLVAYTPNHIDYFTSLDISDRALLLARVKWVLTVCDLLVGLMRAAGPNLVRVSQSSLLQSRARSNNVPSQFIPLEQLFYSVKNRLKISVSFSSSSGEIVWDFDISFVFTLRKRFEEKNKI